MPLSLPVYLRGKYYYLHVRVNGRQFKRSLQTSSPAIARLRAVELWRLVTMEIKKYEINPLTGTIKADGPEDHALAMDAYERLGLKTTWGRSTGNLPPTDATEIIAPRAPIEAGPGTGPRYRKLLDTFKSLKPNISPATIREYETVVTEFEAKFGFISITEVTDDKITSYMEHLAKKKNSETTIDKKIGVLRALFNFGKQQKLCAGENPATGRNLLSKEEKEARGHKFYELDELKEIFARDEFRALKQTKPNFRLLAVAAAITGVRITALATLELKHLRISEQGRPYLQITNDKTGAGRRSVPVPKALFDEMKAYLEAHRDFGYRAREDGKGASDGVRKDLLNYLSEIGIDSEGFTIHGLRKTLNEFMASYGVDRVALYQFMGHVLNDVNTRIYRRSKEGTRAKLTVDQVAEQVLPSQQALLDLIEFA